MTGYGTFFSEIMENGPTRGAGPGLQGGWFALMLGVAGWLAVAGVGAAPAPVRLG